MKLNSRQHRFALNILAGQEPKVAFDNAGYSNWPGSIASGPYHLLAMPLVAQFIAEKRRLKEAIVLASDVSETIASPVERKQILTELLRARLVDFQDEDGQPRLDKDTPNNRAAREYYHRTRYNQRGEAVTTKSIKLTDPITAIAELNKMDGSYAPSKHLIGKDVRVNVIHTERKLITDDSEAITT